MWVHETPIFGVIFVTLTENSSIITNDRHSGTSEISIPPEIAVGMYFHAWTWHENYPSILELMEKPLGRYFQVLSPYYQVTECNQKTPIPVSSRWQVKKGLRKPKKDKHQH